MTPLIRTLIVTNLLLILSILILGAWLYTVLPTRDPDATSGNTAELTMPPETQADGELNRIQPGGTNHSLNAREIESIVRDTVRSELRRLDDPGHADTVSDPTVPTPSVTSVREPNDPRRIEEIRIQHRIVAEELDHFIQQGRISRTEMSALQIEIGKLPPEGRIAAMRRLVAALNSGELKGQL